MSNCQTQFILSGFGNEIASDLETQLNVVEEANLHHIEFGSVDDTNVLDRADELTLDTR